MSWYVAQNVTMYLNHMRMGAAPVIAAVLQAIGTNCGIATTAYHCQATAEACECLSAIMPRALQGQQLVHYVIVVFLEFSLLVAHSHQHLNLCDK